MMPVWEVKLLCEDGATRTVDHVIADSHQTATNFVINKHAMLRSIMDRVTIVQRPEPKFRLPPMVKDWDVYLTGGSFGSILLKKNFPGVTSEQVRTKAIAKFALAGPMQDHILVVPAGEKIDHPKPNSFDLSGNIEQPVDWQEILNGQMQELPKIQRYSPPALQSRQRLPSLLGSVLSRTAPKLRKARRLKKGHGKQL